MPVPLFLCNGRAQAAASGTTHYRCVTMYLELPGRYWHTDAWDCLNVVYTRVGDREIWQGYQHAAQFLKGTKGAKT